MVVTTETADPARSGTRSPAAEKARGATAASARPTSTNPPTTSAGLVVASASSIPPAASRPEPSSVRRSAAERGLLVQPGELVRVADRVDAGDPAVLDHEGDRRVELAGQVDPRRDRAVEQQRCDLRARRDL